MRKTEYFFQQYVMSTVRRPLPFMVDMEDYTYQVAQKLLYGTDVGPCICDMTVLDLCEECDDGGHP